MKFSKRVLLLTILAFCSLNYNLRAEEKTVKLAQLPPKPADISSLPVGIQGRISLDLRNIEVVEALKFLSLKAGLNIIATKNVAGRITLMVQDVPVRDIFDIMLRSNDLAYAKEGDIYNVMSAEEYKTLFGKRFADIRQVKVFRLKYAIPEQAFSLLDTLKSEVGRVLVEPDSGTALIMDTPEKITEIEKALATLEEKNLVQVFQLKYAKAKEVEEQIKTQLDAKKVGSIRADERSNQVFVQTLPERMQGIENLINALDKKTKEVLIDTKIVKVKLSDEITSGIEWEGLFSLGNKLGTTYMGSYPFSVIQSATSTWQSRREFLTSKNQIGAYPFSGNTASVNTSTKVVPGEKMHLGMVSSKQDFDILMKYLQTLGKTQILSNPKLAVLNNQEATIHVGERRYYIKSTLTKGQTSDTVSEEPIEYRVGIKLAVTPTINDDGYVTMKVKPEVDSVIDFLTTPLGNKLPIIDTSMAETTVMVQDGATIIIGGLRKEEKVSSSEHVPVLGRIPFLGFLFRSATNKTERTELLVMLTPHIVSGETLVTADERIFGTELGKEYKGYPSFTEEIELKPSQKPSVSGIEAEEDPDQEIKPYREYRSFE